MPDVSSFIPDDEYNDESDLPEDTIKSFIPDKQKKDVFKPAPEALKVDNEEVDKLLREAHESLNKTTDWRNQKVDLEPQKNVDSSNWNLRPDGSKKGMGHLGVYKNANGDDVSEYSIADSEQLKDDKGNYQDYPVLVPGLTKDEIQHVLDSTVNKSPLPQSIKDKAEAFALERRSQGKSLFADDSPEAGYNPKPKKGFFQGLKDTGESLYEQVNKAGKSSFENIKRGNYPGAFHDITSLATDPFEGLTKAAINLSSGRRPIETTPEQAKEFAIGVSGIPADRVLQAYREGDYGRLAGQGLSAAALLALSHGAGKLGENFGSSSELPVRSEMKDVLKPEELHPSELPPDLVPLGSEDIFNQPRKEAEALRTDGEAPIDYESKFKDAQTKLAEIKGEKPKYGNIDSFVPDEKSNPLSDYKSEERPLLRADASKMTAPQLEELNRFMESVKDPDLAKMQEEIRAPRELPVEDRRFPADEAIDLGELNPKAAEEQITARHIGTQPGMPASEFGEAIPEQHLYNIEGGKEHGFTVSEQGLKDRGIPVPEVNQDLIGKTGKQIREDALRAKDEQKFVNPFEKKEPESFTPDEVSPEEMSSEEHPSSFVPDNVPEDQIVEMHGGLGGFSPRSKKAIPFEGRHAVALEALFNSMGKVKENVVKQEMLNKQERARRFAAFEGVKDEGRKGASKALSTLKGDYESVENDKLKMGRKETDSLFTAIKGANITTPEKVRGYSAMFKLLNGEQLQRNEVQLLDTVFGNSFGERVVEMHGGLGAVGLKVSKIANTMKSMKSSLDLSAPLRQGIGLIHKPEYRQAFKEMFKYYGNKEYYNAAMEAIQEDPDFLKSREAGLFLAKHDSITQSEEAFANNYVGEIPKITGIPMAVDASERAYTGFLNTLRFQTFKNLVKNAETAGNQVFAEKQLRDSKGSFILDDAGNVKTTKIPTSVAENIAKYINVSTGRGGLGRLEKIAPELNSVLWSPRLISSRLSILNPKYYMNMDSFTRKEAIKSLFAIAASGVTVASLAKQAGAKVSTDPTSADFGKARMGNNVLDPYAGFQQPIVAAVRMMSEINRMASGKPKGYNKPNILEIGGNFLANKEAPLVSFAHELATAQKFTGGGNYVSRFGQKKNITPEIANAFTPMFIQDVMDVFKNDPSFGEQVGLDTASLFGMGVQSYPESGGSKPKTFRKMSTK